MEKQTIIQHNSQHVVLALTAMFPGEWYFQHIVCINTQTASITFGRATQTCKSIEIGARAQTDKGKWALYYKDGVAEGKIWLVYYVQIGQNMTCAAGYNVVCWAYWIDQPPKGDTSLPSLGQTDLQGDIYHYPYQGRLTSKEIYHYSYQGRLTSKEIYHYPYQGRLTSKEIYITTLTGVD